MRDQLARHYYKPVPQRLLRLRKIEQMIAGLRDPYTEYLEPFAYSELRRRTAASYSGIGATVLPQRGGFVVSAVPAGPARDSGLSPGDTIVAIDGVATRAPVVRGGARPDPRSTGTSVVRLGILRGDRVLDVEVRRDEIRTSAVTSLVLAAEGRRAGYIALHSFAAGTAQLLHEELRELEAAGATRLVLDLRDNPGGLLDQAVAVSSLFLARGRVVSIQAANERPQVLFAAGRSRTSRLPLVVLVNRYTASAAEVVAAALHDNGRATARRRVDVREGARPVDRAAPQRRRAEADDGAVPDAGRRGHLPTRAAAGRVGRRRHVDRGGRGAHGRPSPPDVDLAGPAVRWPSLDGQRPQQRPSSRSPSAASSSSASRTSHPGTPIVLDRHGLGDARHRATSRSSARDAGAPGSSACSGRADDDRGGARGPARPRGRAGRVRAARASPSRASRGASTCATSSRSRSTRTRRKDFDDAISVRREGDGLRAWVHIADVSHFVPAGTPLDRGAAEPCVLDVRARASSRRCCRPTSPTTRAASARTSTGCASRSRSPSTPALEPGEPTVLPLGDPQQRALHVRAGGARSSPAASAPATELGEALALAERLAAELRRRRFARGALRIETGEIDVRVRRPGRRRARVARERAARARAGRGADDPRERGGRRRCSPAAGGRRSTASTSGPTRRRCCCSSAKLADLDVPTPPVPDEERLTPADAAALAAATAERVTSYAAQSGRGARGVPGARPALAEAGALPPGRTSATRASRAARTATSRRRSAATRTSSCTARCCASSALADDPPAGGSRRARRRTRRSASARPRRSSTSPTSSASPGCSSGELFERGWEAPWEGEIIGLIGSGLFVRFGEVFEGFLPARRLPGDYFELDAARHRARRPALATARYRLGDPIAVRVEEIRRPRARSSFALAGSDARRST